MNYSNKRKFPSKWQKEDSDQEEASDESFDEKEDAEISDLKNLLRELLNECRRLSTYLSKPTYLPKMQ